MVALIHLSRFQVELIPQTLLIPLLPAFLVIWVHLYTLRRLVTHQLILLLVIHHLQIIMDHNMYTTELFPLAEGDVALGVPLLVPVAVLRMDDIDLILQGAGRANRWILVNIGNKGFVVMVRSAVSLISKKNISRRGRRHFHLIAEVVQGRGDPKFVNFGSLVTVKTESDVNLNIHLLKHLQLLLRQLLSRRNEILVCTKPNHVKIGRQGIVRLPIDVLLFIQGNQPQLLLLKKKIM